MIKPVICERSVCHEAGRGCSLLPAAYKPAAEPISHKGTAPKVALDQNFLPLLGQNQLEGFHISLGTSKEAVIKNDGGTVNQNVKALATVQRSGVQSCLLSQTTVEPGKGRDLHAEHQQQNRGTDRRIWQDERDAGCGRLYTGQQLGL
jgi:hypothetical protein